MRVVNPPDVSPSASCALKLRPTRTARPTPRKVLLGHDVSNTFYPSFSILRVGQDSGENLIEPGTLEGLVQDRHVFWV